MCAAAAAVARPGPKSGSAGARRASGSLRDLTPDTDSRSAAPRPSADLARRFCIRGAQPVRRASRALEEIVKKVVTDSAASAVHRGRFHRPLPFHPGMNSHFIAILWSKGVPNRVICRRRMRRDQRWFIRTYSAGSMWREVDWSFRRIVGGGRVPSTSHGFWPGSRIG